MAGLLDEIRKSQYLQMADEKIQGLLNLRESAQRFMTSPTSFLGLLGQNPLPKESGFAAGATGLPPTEMSVLDPMQAPYMQGYSQGEPVGIAAMALPFAAPAAVAAGKALAPKAGQALESYMVNQGMIQPITAYHGTPHTIQGKFDINKVGTGEGNQTYGYGMYFAENPVVAGEYAANIPKAQTGLKVGNTKLKFTENPKTTKEEAHNYLIENARMAQVEKPEMTAMDVLNESWYGAPNQQIQDEIFNLINSNKKASFTTPKGNLYKVDIPDADIPFMLDYDKPLSQQPKAVQDALAKYDSDLYSPKSNDYDSNELGQSIYQRIVQDNVQKFGLGGNSKRASEDLNALGIKGIRYYDEGSRQAGGTSNFVVFEPSTVKILEKNSEKVEGLLD